MYKVIEYFTSTENLRGIPLIELVEPEKAGKGKSKNKAVDSLAE